MSKYNNQNLVKLDLRVSCTVFWKYQMTITVNRDDFRESNENPNINISNSCCNSTKSPVFSRLDRFLCDAMISHIHEDLALNGTEEQIAQLCDISSKFHIHGHTTESLLYGKSDIQHTDQVECVYICSHC